MVARHPPCRALKPKEKDYKVTDRDGMYVHVTAKGAMSFRFADSAAVAAGSRFDSSTAQGKLYRDRYMNDAYLDALAEIHRSCAGYPQHQTLPDPVGSSHLGQEQTSLLPPTALVCQCQVNFGLVTTLLQPLRLAPITRGASLSPAHQRPRVAM